MGLLTKWHWAGLARPEALQGNTAPGRLGRTRSTKQERCARLPRVDEAETRRCLGERSRWQGQRRGIRRSSGDGGRQSSPGMEGSGRGVPGSGDGRGAGPHMAGVRRWTGQRHGGGWVPAGERERVRERVSRKEGKRRGRGLVGVVSGDATHGETPLLLCLALERLGRDLARRGGCGESQERREWSAGRHARPGCYG